MSGSSRGSSEMTKMKWHRLGWVARVEEHEVSRGKEHQTGSIKRRKVASTLSNNDDLCSCHP